MRVTSTQVMWLGTALLTGTLSGAAQTSWDVTKTIPIGGEGGWDYATVDPATHQLFVTRSTHTMVIDAASGKVVGDVPGQKRSHGTAIVPSLGRGFITDGGGDGAIVVFDLKTYAVLGKLAAMPDSDGIIYDKAQDLVLAVSGDKGMLMTFKAEIDPVNGKIDAPIDLGGAPEFLASDGEKAYVNLEDKDMVAVVDLKSRKVIASLPIGAGVDATAVDGGRAFASCGDGSLTVVGEKAGTFVVEQVVKTKFGARTMGVDESTHTIYLPTAEYEPLEAGERRPKAKPDTFMIVEAGQK